MPLKLKQVITTNKKASLALLSFFLLFIILPSTFLLNQYKDHTQTRASTSTNTTPPPAGGYFQLVLPGKFDSLPSDAQAAAMVHRSTWEPRAVNYTANHTLAPSTLTQTGYSGMQNHTKVFGRITGNFSGTTDEIIQWAAAKWGLPDEVIRAEAIQESNWYQNYKDSNGNPIQGQGYGDFGSCSKGTPRYGQAGPSSFGLLQVKWCSLTDNPSSNYGGWPWTEDSTAFSIDEYAAVLRGCYEGWETWRGNGYAAGDLWGCLGGWFSGSWYNAGAVDYINRVKNIYNTRPWLSWANQSGQVPYSTPTSTPTLTPTPTSSGLTPNAPVKLDNTSVTPGETLTGTITYTNINSTPITIKAIVITARAPGGTNVGGPYYDFSPRQGATTLQSGQSITLKASRTLSSTEPTGQWYTYSSYQDSNSVWHDGKNVYFTVGLANTPTATPSTTPYLIYGNNLASGWANWSWNSSVNFANTDPVYEGSNSIAYQANGPYGGLNLHTDTGTIGGGFARRGTSGSARN